MTNHTLKIRSHGRRISIYFYIIFFILFISSCATLNEQKSIGNENTNDLKKITYSFYIAGGLGNSSKVSNEHLLERFKEELDNAPENSTLVFTGDNISPTTKNWEKDSLLVQQQLISLLILRVKPFFCQVTTNGKATSSIKSRK